MPSRKATRAPITLAPVDEVSVTREIAASPQRVWAMVADLPRMGEWSPENEGATWRKGASGPVSGARFVGRNRNGAKRWTTDGVVVDADPGRVFCFRITVKGVKVAQWRYAFEPTATGCQVTETWTDQRSALAKLVGGRVSGVSDRPTHNRATMEATLDRLKAAAEAAEAATPSS